MIAELIQPDDPRWTEVLREAAHDVYHLPAYARFSGLHEGGVPVAFHARDERGAMLAPLLLRRLPTALGAADHLQDATTPYGYASPITTNPANGSAVEDYLRAFTRVARDAGVVTAFFRLHPLLSLPHDALARHGRVTMRGETVPIPLNASLDTLRAETRTNHRTGIRKLAAAGYTATMDDWTAYAAFGALYRETMRRVEAADFYLFSDAYFADLRAALGDRLHLCTVRAPGGDLAAAGVFMETDGIVEYHLGGTAGAYLALAPSKVMFDHVRQWAKERGCSVLHLGGGLGGRCDSLFNFKAGFSSARAAFATYEMVLDPARYIELTTRAGQSAGAGDPDYFPAYRAPHRPAPLLETVR